MLRMQEMAFLRVSNFKNFLGEYAPNPPIHAWYVGHTHGLQPLPIRPYPPLTYYLT
jgi:hypothetical protein